MKIYVSENAIPKIDHLKPSEVYSKVLNDCMHVYGVCVIITESGSVAIIRPYERIKARSAVNMVLIGEMMNDKCVNRYICGRTLAGV